MNITIFKNIFKRNWILLLIFTVILCFYQGTIISLVNTEDMTSVQELYGSMEGMLKAFGIDITTMTDPLSYTASTFFGLLVLAFPMVYYIILIIKLVIKPIENYSLSYILTSPVSRSKYIVTLALYLLLSLFIMFMFVFITGSVMLNTTGSFNVLAYLNLVTVTYLLCSSIAMFTFFIAVMFCNSKNSVFFTVSIPVGLLILNMLGSVSDKLSFLTKYNPFGLLQSVKIVNGEISTLWMYVAFTIAIVILLMLSVKTFDKKQLSV